MTDSSTNHPSELRETTNRAPDGLEFPDVRSLWHRRELFFFLTWRDVKVRYKQTVLGALWAILQPVTAAAIFTIVFGRIAQLSSEGYPYSLFVYTALVPWTFFSTALSQSASSLVTQERMLTKVYFPRLLIPMAAVAAVLVDLAATIAVLFALLLIFSVAPTWNVLLLPFFVALTALVASAAGTWLSAVNVRYRDVRYVIPFLLQIWFFATPIAYSSSIVPDPWRWILELNPMVGIVDGFRWAVLGADLSTRSLLISMVVTAAGILVSLVTFGRLEATFADEI